MVGGGGEPHLQISLEKYKEKESRRTNTDGSTREADTHTHPLTAVRGPRYSQPAGFKCLMALQPSLFPPAQITLPLLPILGTAEELALRKPPPS